MDSQKGKSASSKNSKSRQTIRSKQRQSSSGPNETPPVKGSQQRSVGGRRGSNEGNRSNSGSRLQNPASVKKQEGRKLARIRNLDRNTADEAVERKKQEELRKQIAIKEQQLKEMTEAAKRLKGRIGSGTLPDIRAPNISAGGEVMDHNVLRAGDLDTIPSRGTTKSPAQMRLSEKFKADDVRKPQPLSNKNPISGGGLRSQKFQKSQDSNELRRLKDSYDARRPSNQSRHSGDNIPLRNKNSSSINNSLSVNRIRNIGSRNNNTGSRNRDGSAGGTIPASRIFENSQPGQAPLRVKNISPNPQNSSPLRASNSRSRSPPQKFKYGFSRSRQDDENVDIINSSRNQFIRPLPVQQSKISHSNSSKLFQKADNLNLQVRDRIDALHVDNQALQHRFGLVQAELSKTLKEREQLWGKYETVKRDCKHLETKLALQDPVDIDNKNLQNNIAQMKNDAVSNNKLIDNQKLFSAEAAQKTGYVEAEAKDMILKMERMNIEIAVIDQKCESLNAQKVDLLKDMEHVNQLVVEESKQEYGLNLQTIDIDSSNLKLQSERNLLINDLERLTFEYDELVRDISQEKKSLNQQNNDQRKLITAKVIFNNLQKFRFDRKQEAFREIKTYSDFERESFAKLQTFYMLAYRLGRFKQKTAIIQWYNNALRPLGTRYQNQNLSIRKANVRKMAKVFYAWLQYHENRLSTYEQKKQSINLVWEKLFYSAQVEIKRALTIWKEKSRSQNYKNKVFKSLVALKKKQTLVSCLTRWKEWSMLLEQEVRIELLKREYSQKFFLTTLFNSLKQQCFLSRHNRHRVLQLCLKGWIDFIKYKKQFMRTNIATMKFQKTNEAYMIKVCFDALKLNKEKKKTAIMDVALHEDMDVVIERYQGKKKKIESRMVRSSKKKVSNIVRLMMQRRLFSYIQHWKQVVLYNDSFLKTKFKDQIFQVYRKTLLRSFLIWRRNSADVKKRRKRRIIKEMVEENQEKERESLEKEHNLKSDHTVVMAVRENKGHKTFKKFVRRVQQTALYRWRDTLNEFKNHKRYQDEIIRKCRNRFMRESFDIYKKVYLKSLQSDKNKKQAEYMASVLNQRLLQKLFNSFCAYVQRHKVAKRYLNKMMTKLNKCKKQAYIRHWNVQSKLKREQILENKISHQVEEIDDRNKNIGEKEKIDEEQSKQLEDLNKVMIRKARKLLANYMQRYYTDNTQLRFRQWKEAVRLKREQQQTIRKMLYHLKKTQFTVLKNALKTNVSMDIQRERILLTREKEIETEIHQQSIIHSQEVLQETRVKSKKSITQSKQKQVKHEKRFGKAIEVMSNKNITTLLVSKKRRIFESWQHAARQQRAFILCIVNVLEKSIWMKGFHCIREGVRDLKKQDKFLRHMNQITIKLAKNYMVSCFNKWKLQSLKKVCTRSSSVMTANEHTISAFNYHISQIKDQNTSRVFYYLQNRTKANIFKTWKNIKNHLKIKRIKEEEIKQMFKNVRTKRALQKMFLRTETTIRIRNNFKTFKRDKAWRLKRMVWDTLLVRRTIHTDLATTISNLEKLFRDKNKIETFKTLQAYAASRHVACNRFKKQATINIKNLLTNIHMNRLKRYFLKYRAIIKTKTVERKTVKKILLKIDNANRKDFIRKWKEWMEGQVLAQEMNESGPITEQVFEAQRAIYNLKDFMKNESYGNELIAKKVELAEDHNYFLMNKVVKRLMIPRQNRAAMTKVFEHWKMWVKMKRLIKYHIMKANDYMTPIKADLRWCFNQWRKADKLMLNHLESNNFAWLETRNVSQAKVLDVLADREAENSAIISHLNMQRDELLENFLKAQKLALCLLNDNHRKARERAWRRWKLFVQIAQKGDGEAQIYQSVHEIQKIKSRTTELEKQNDHLAKENADLRQFSIDGFTIAKNVQQLSDEREKLSADLADKTDTVAELLAQNQMLRKELGLMGIEPEQIVGKPGGRLKQSQIRQFKDGRTQSGTDVM